MGQYYIFIMNYFGVAGANIHKKQGKQLAQALLILAVTPSPLAHEEMSLVTGLHVLNETSIALMNYNHEILTQ